MKIATMTAVPSTRPVIISRGFRVPLWLALPLFYGAVWLMAMAFPGGEPGKLLPVFVKLSTPCPSISDNPSPGDQLSSTVPSIIGNDLGIDFDIDSDNNGEITPDDETEDLMEADDYPGKAMTINDGDSDKNGFPDYADCSAGRPTGSTTSLVPIRIKLTLPPGKTWDTCQLYIQYPAVAENLRQLMPDGSIKVLEPGADTEPGAIYLPPEESWWGPWYDETSLRLRLWTKEGKFIAPGRYYSASIEDDPTRTFDYLGIAGDTAIVEFWAEGCTSAADFQYLYVGLGEWESDTYVTDTINVTVNAPASLDLDVDSDNNGTIDGSDAEDDTEDIAGQPGKIIPLGNDADADNDGVPDFADGFDLEPEGRRDSATDKLDKVRDNQSTHGMIPIILRLPDDIDLETAVLRLDYDASTPADVGVKIDRKDKRTYTLPPETVVFDPQDPTREILMRRTLRLWREKQDGQGNPLGLTVRNKASVLDKAEGSYVPPGAYSKDKLARLGFKKGTPDGNTVTLWLEGVRASLAPGDCRITVSLDPDDEGPLPEKALEDTVRVTVMPAGIIPDWNRDGIINPDDQGKVTATTPWRIWKNDDLDKTTAASGILENNGVDLPGAKDGDGQDLVVNGIRDLVDFFPFFLDVGTLRKIYPFEEYQYKLRYPGTLHAFCGEPGLGLSAANVGALHKDIGIAEALKNRGLALVNADGLLLDPEFLAQPEPIIFIEGVEAGNGYLELVVAKQGTTVFSTRLPLQVCDILQMFFRKDLCVAVSNALDGTGDCPVPSRLPFFTARDNWLVMVHGYDVNADNALMCFAETYKRFFHSGSNARYCGVNWHGRPASTTIGPTSYHQAVVNAFATAPAFARFVNELPGTRTVIGHSLGNMVVGAAICLPQNPAQVSSYIALDAAVAKEAWGDIVMPEDLAGSPLNDKGFFIDPNAWAYNVPIDSLGTWPELVAAGGGQLLASEWYRLFDANDRRSQLTWRNRFKELTTRTTAYNFYSSTEDVVGNLNDGSLLSDKGLLESTSYAWHKQEKLKGRRYVYNVVPGIDWENLGNCMSDFCGWSASPYYRQFQDEGLNGLGWIFAMGKNAASISGFLSGSISELNAAKQRFQEFDWIQTPIDIIMTTLGAINSVLTNTWSFLTGNLSSAAKKTNVLEIRFKDPQDLLKATIQPRAVQTMARVQAMADAMSKKENKPVTVKELLKTQPYFAVDSGLYLKYIRLFRKNRFQNLTETIGGTTPSKFLESRASTIKDITEYYNKNNLALRQVSVKDWLLAEGFPATTNAVGANPVNIKSFGKNQNVDMGKLSLDEACMTDYRLWPRRNGNERFWFHSDFKNIPFVHNYKFYEKVTNIFQATGGNP